MKKRIPITKLWFDNSEIKAINKVLNSGFVTEGPYTRKFEKLVANYTNSKYAVATSSGTAALHSAFYAMNIKGKKVLVSDFTFPATALAIQMAGGIPVLIDVEKDTMNTSKSIIENSLDEEIEFLSPVSLFGNPLEEKFYSLKRQGLKIIEDAATNLGTKINNKSVGSLANVTCFSFHPRKIVTTGEGGMITTNDQKLFKKLKKFKFFGKSNTFSDFGINYKMSDILASIGISQLKKIEKIIKSKQTKAKIYNEFFNKISFIEPQKQITNSKHTYQSYVCTITKSGLRDKIIRELAKNNIESQLGTYSLHSLPYFKNCLKKGSLSNSSFLYDNTITLPLYPGLSQTDQEKICKIIQKCLN